MSDNRDVAAKLLGEAAETILKKRPGVHGSAENSFAMIGEMWTVYLRHARQVRKHDNILPQDVAQMMADLKKCRAMYGDKNNPDNFVDDIGYVALAGMLQLPDPDTKPEIDVKAIDRVENDIAAAMDRPGAIVRNPSPPMSAEKFTSDNFAGNDGRSAPKRKVGGDRADV